MFYHIKIAITGLTSWFSFNDARDELLSTFICPLIKGETTILDGKIFNMSSFGSVKIYKTDHIVDSDWPVKKSPFFKEMFGKKEFDHYEYKKAVEREFEEVATDVTAELYKEAIILIASGKYKVLRKRIEEEKKKKYTFFICPFGNEEVNHNYEYVIKPLVEKYQYIIQRVDEISHTNLITNEILNAISKSDFIVADLTDERPNCYYEIGFAHALGRPIIILAKEGTSQHFDIAGYKWNYWKDYKDLKPIFEKELDAIVEIKNQKIN